MEQLDVARRVELLSATSQRKVDVLQATVDAFIAHREAERGVEADQLCLEDVFVTDDERALLNLICTCSVEAGAVAKFSANDTFDHVVARLAFERGWLIIDAARAILGNAAATVDTLRDTPQHAKARRVRDAMKTALKAQIQKLDLQLAALDNERPTKDAAPVLMAGALMSLVFGRELGLGTLQRGVRDLREQKTRFLEALGRRAER